MIVVISVVIILIIAVAVAAFWILSKKNAPAAAPVTSPVSSPTPAPAPGPAPAGSGTDAGGPSQYAKFDNTALPLSGWFAQGQEYADATEAECKKECDKPSNRCVGFNLNAATNKCRLFTSDPEVGTSVGIKDRTGAYVVTKNVMQPGASSFAILPNVTEARCAAECTARNAITNSTDNKYCSGYAYAETKNGELSTARSCKLYNSKIQDNSFGSTLFLKKSS